MQDGGGRGGFPFIACLDIFGFENFARNSFEQLCINYANEKLQARFTADVFRGVQAEYEAEGLPWSRVSYADNSEVRAGALGSQY